MEKNQELNQTVNYYNENAIALSQRYENANVSKIQSTLIKIFENSNSLLEIGCGSARDFSFLNKNGFKNILAIDSSSEMINEAKRLHPELSKKLFYKSLFDQWFLDLSFDGIYSIATLMHLQKDELNKSIFKIYNLLNMNGKVFISVSLVRDDIDENGFDENGRFFLVQSEYQWLELLIKYGFKIISHEVNNDGLNRDNIKWLTIIAQKV